MNEFSFIAPWADEPTPLVDLIKTAWSEGTDRQWKELLKSGVYVDGADINNEKFRVDAGSHVTFRAPDGTRDVGYPDWPELRRYQDVVFVEKPVGIPGSIEADDPMHPVLFLADELGLDRNTVLPVWDCNSRVGGPWPLAGSESSVQALLASELSFAWYALVAIPIAGSFTYEGRTFDISVVGRREGLTEVHVTIALEEPLTNLPDTILEMFAEHGSPVVGDVHRGGLLTDYTRLRVQAFWDPQMEGDNWSMPKDWWPGQIVPPVSEAPVEPKEESGYPTFQISKASLHHVRLGHPWVLEDRDSDKGSFRSGTLVRLATKTEDVGPLAIATNETPIVARVWGEGSYREEIPIRLDEALADRGAQFANLSDTDLFRLINGENDGFPGLFVDRLGSVLRVTHRSQCTSEYRDFLYDALIEREPDLTIVETTHDADIRQKDNLPVTRIISHGSSHVAPGDRIVGREHGLKYWLELWEGIDPGFFADQRDNRSILLDADRDGERWLNLFCHTGAFSVALGSVGAQTDNVDLSVRYLDWFLENLSLNQIPADGHTCHAVDARKFLEGCDEMYDGIIVDPPTSSSGSGGFWSVRKDYPALLKECFAVLKPGGTMLACLNERGTKIDFPKMVTDAADRPVDIATCGPPSDYPWTEAFPEGRTFVGAWVGK